MYEYNRLDTDGLKQIGIAFETEKESRAFTELIQTELQVRIGKAISENLSAAQLAEFDAITDNTEIKRWLDDNCPDYRQIVRTETGKVKAELLRCRTRIDGLCDRFEMKANSTPIEALKLTSCSELKRAGIDTIGELRKLADLSQIRSLSPSYKREINEKLNEYLASPSPAEDQNKDTCTKNVAQLTED